MHHIRLCAIFLLAGLALQAEMKLINGLAWDTEKREVLAADGVTVLDKQMFRQFPNYPSAKGIEEFRKLVDDAIGRGIPIRTRLSEDNGQVVVLADVGDSSDDLLLRGYPIGRTLEYWVRHGSRQAALQNLRANANSPSRLGSNITTTPSFYYPRFNTTILPANRP